MNEIIQKISTYNIFNYLLPGIVFVALLRFLTTLDLIVDDLLIGLFLYYFIGMVISRIGSILVEPILEKTKIIKRSDYQKFIQASKNDKKIELLSEEGNVYRTFISMLLILILVVSYECIRHFIVFGKVLKSIIGLAALVLLFIQSYRKQNEYINRRINLQNAGK